MTPVVVVSILLDLLALGWTLLLLRRLRDWRLAFLTAMLAMLAAHQLLEVLLFAGRWGTPVAAVAGRELTGSAVSVFAILAVLFTGRLFVTQRQARDELEIEKASLEQLFQSSPEAVVVLDNSDRVVRINEAFTDMFGYEPDEAVGREINELIAPKPLWGEATGLSHQVIEGHRVSVETVRCRKDGTPVLVSILGAPVKVENEQIAIYGIYRDITKRKRAEEALLESEKRFRNVFEHGPMGMALVDGDSRFVQTNHAFTELVGYTGDELQWKTLLDVTHPDDASEGQRRIADLAHGRADRFSGETRYLHRDGSVVWCQTTVAAVRDEDQRFLYVVAMLENITARRRAQQALRESEERFSKAFKSSPNLMTITEQDTGRILEVNASVIETLGYSRDEVVGRTAFELGIWAQPRDRVRLRRLLEKRGEVRDLEVDLLAKSGDRRTCLLSAELIEIGGSPSVLLVAVDITERKRTEAALRESEERYALAARGATDGLWDWNLTTQEIYLSPRWKQMLGYEEDELGEDPSEWLDRVHPEDLELLRAALGAHIEGHTPHLENEHRVLHKSGDYLWVLVRGIAIRDSDGEPYRMAGSLTDITERKLGEERLRHDALHDNLTELPNRALFVDLLGRSLRRGQRYPDQTFAVLFLDIDRFKLVNDSLGHLVGDRVLVEIARRLEGCLRPEDVVARLGGDEFTVLLENIRGMEDVTHVADRIRETLARPFTVEGQEVFLTASMGIALSSAGYELADHILRDADTAMYRAKARGKASFEVFNRRMHVEAVTLLQMETDLRRALDRDEFEIHYQPIVSLASRELVGFEALVRWIHPQRGLIYPGEFITTAEETGLIVTLGEWVLSEACRQMRRWRGRLWSKSRAGIFVSVNLSARQFEQPNLMKQVQHALKTSRLPASNLKLEITESALMDDAEQHVALVRKLKDRGVTIQIDDFGTGYSSLSYLHRFLIDALKIDRSFVCRLDNGAEDTEIVSSILSLGRNLGLEVIAEGVETAEQAEQLLALNCRYAQGFFFYPPLKPKTVEGMASDLLRSVAAAPRRGAQRSRRRRKGKKASSR